jgi:hypothetical protein
MQSLNNSMVVETEGLLVPKCSFCKQMMEISEGDVIYDSRWYHKSCWDGMEREQCQGLSDANKSGFVSVAHYA